MMGYSRPAVYLFHNNDYLATEVIQEAQLMLTNPHDAFRRSVKVSKHGTIPYVKYDFLLVCYSNFVSKTHSFWDILLQKICNLENRVKGPSRSLETSPFDRAHMTSYWRSIVVTMALYRVVSEIFNVKIPW